MESKGQALIEAMEAWIGSWVAFPGVPSNQPLIAALWALHTWFAPRWPATAYAHITGDGPGVGKTVLLEVLASLSLNPKSRATLRVLEVVRAIEQADSQVTYFFDEVEKLSAAGASEMRSVLTTGYKRGGTHGVTVGQRSVEFSTYSAKAFASIGDLEEVFRSRSVVFRLTWGVPARSWTDAVMVRGGEAKALLEVASRVLPSGSIEWVPPPFLAGREREIWSPIWSVALALGLDAPMMRRVRRAIDDFSQLKLTTAKKTYRDMVPAETKDAEREYAELALRDLARVLPSVDGRKITGHIFSSTAVAAMRELDGPWRVFNRSGLDMDRLAALLSRFGVEPKQIREAPGLNNKQGRGYRRDTVLKAVALLEAKE